MNALWTRDEAFAFCRLVEAIAPQFGGHVALTGGCLYKDGPRKDCDILVYRIRQVPQVDFAGLFAALRVIDVEQGDDFGWCKKATWNGKSIDFFDPEDDSVAPEYGV